MRTLSLVHRKEEGVMIGELFVAVDMHESGDFHAIRGGKDIRCLQIEKLGVEIIGLLVVAD